MPRRLGHNLLQLEMDAIANAPATKPTWGGARAGAGRKRLPPARRKTVAHRPRVRHAKSRPVHITMRARPGLPSFRNELVLDMMLRVLSRQLAPQRKYTDVFKVIHFSIQSNHLHVMVEAIDKTALRSGVSGLVIAFAKRLNELLRRKTGKVWAHRFHSHELGSPREVRNALSYVFNNYKKHGVTTHGDGIVDSFSSAPSFDQWHVTVLTPMPYQERHGPPPWRPADPRTWLLETGWKPLGPIHTNERPA
jgi:REP element-mobilizing transposase RayT